MGRERGKGPISSLAEVSLLKGVLGVFCVLRGKAHFALSRVLGEVACFQYMKHSRRLLGGEKC